MRGMSEPVLVTLQDRNRANLGKLAEHDRYLVHREPDGTLIWEPAEVVSATEARLLADFLHIAAHEVLRVALEHLVDFVQQVVQLFLQLLALVGGRRGGLLDRLVGSGGRRLLLQLTLCHVSRLPPRSPTAPTARKGSNIPPTTYRPSRPSL